MTSQLLHRSAAFLHHRLVWLLIAAYAVAAYAPAVGTRLRTSNVGTLHWGGEHVVISWTALLLAVLLFNAGLGVDPARLVALTRRTRLLATGLLANLAVPLVVILGLSATLALWHNPTEVQAILLGLALIASMPIAGSSTAWSQNADGDLPLSVGLVLGSTIISPIGTPAVLHAVGWVAHGPFAENLHALAAGGTRLFLLLVVLGPTVIGVVCRGLLGTVRFDQLKPGLKVVNSAVLLTLCYANAAAALPKALSRPDWDYLAIILVVVTLLCVVGFVAGQLVARGFGIDSGGRSALMFGLGMTNNGTGMVVAATALAHLPDVMLPVIGYNLVQHVVAAVALRMTSSPLVGSST